MAGTQNPDVAFQAFARNDIQVDISLIDEGQYMISLVESDEVMEFVEVVLRDALVDEGFEDFSIASTDTVVSLIIH
jgi:hypothetical protein